MNREQDFDCHSPLDMEKMNGNEMIVPARKLKRVSGRRECELMICFSL
jgi:hypothetical protein